MDENINKIAGDILITACHMGNESVVNDIMSEIKKYGIDINKIGNLGETALTSACIGGNFPAIKILIANGADVNIKNKYGETAIYKACRHGNINIVKYLIENKADINYVRIDSCIFTTIFNGHTEIAKLLIENNIDINAKDDIGNTILTYACDNHDYDLVKFLIGKIDIESKNNYGETALAVTCKCREFEMCRESSNRSKCSEKTLKILDDYVNIFKLLVEHGANINSISDLGLSCMMIACQYENIDIVRELILKGADINYVNKNKMTAFLYSLNDETKQNAKMILSMGYDYSEDIKQINDLDKEFVTTYVKSDEYITVKDNIFQPTAANIFSTIVYVSDDYLRM